MEQTSSVKNKNHLVSNIFLHVLSGLIIAFLSALLIYFKQKEVFHHAVILFPVFAIYFLGYNFRKWLATIPQLVKGGSLIFVLIICWLGPQFIYQIRPYTFYISGLAMGSVLIVAISSFVLTQVQPIRYLWNYIPFLAGYVVGYLVPPQVLQYLIVGLLFMVTIIFLFSDQFKSVSKAAVSGAFAICVMVFWWFSSPIIFHKEQTSYEDKVLFTAETQYHKLVVTQWHKDQWFFIDKLKNISSIDEYLYYEPMTHGVFNVADRIEEVLVIGGENGCLIREVLKYENVKKVDVVSYDTLLRNLGIENQYFTKMNNSAYAHEKVQIIHKDLLEYVTLTNKKFDAIFIDLPDPRSIETNQFYTIEFYNLVRHLLKNKGVMITQAGSPYFATEAFYTIGQTIREAGFNVLPIHNQILTLGEWGWYICSLDQQPDVLKKRLLEQKELEIKTRWFNHEAAQLVSAFGKTYSDTLNIHVNSLENPLVYQYYLKGNWNLN